MSAPPSAVASLASALIDLEGDSDHGMDAWKALDPPTDYVINERIPIGCDNVEKGEFRQSRPPVLNAKGQLDLVATYRTCGIVQHKGKDGKMGSLSHYTRCAETRRSRATAATSRH